MYEIRERPPSPAALARLRAANDMTPRPRAGLERGLGAELFAVVAVQTDDAGDDSDGEGDGSDGERDDSDGTPTDDGDADDPPVVGTARVVGDGASVFFVVDTVVHPDHQGRGLGTRLVDAVDDYVRETAPEGASVALLADVDGFYEQWGFEETRPVSKGMSKRVGAGDKSAAGDDTR